MAVASREPCQSTGTKKALTGAGSHPITFLGLTPSTGSQHVQPDGEGRERTGRCSVRHVSAISNECMQRGDKHAPTQTQIPIKGRGRGRSQVMSQVDQSIRWTYRQVSLYPLHGPCEGPLAASPCSTPLQHSGPASSVPAALSLLLPTLLAHGAATPLPLRNNPPRFHSADFKNKPGGRGENHQPLSLVPPGFPTRKITHPAVRTRRGRACVPREQCVRARACVHPCAGGTPPL